MTWLLADIRQAGIDRGRIFLVDGVIEDYDRQLGTIQELLYCVKAGLSWQEYRDMLKVEAPKKDRLLAILIPKGMDHE